MSNPSQREPKAASVPRLPGISYRTLLDLIHQARSPQLYFEIGIGTGASLAYSRCCSIAVDPDFRLRADVISNKPECHLYRQTSDDFFRLSESRTLFPRPIDLAFLDGLHWFEVLLRDFINTERFCAPDGLILLHDCLPYSVEIAERIHQPEQRSDQLRRMHWAGDVWKLIPILSTYRPDLRMVSFDCPPTGLVTLQGLNPRSTILRDAYDDIVRTFQEIELAEFTIERLFEISNVRSSRGIKTPAMVVERLG